MKSPSALPPLSMLPLPPALVSALTRVHLQVLKAEALVAEKEQSLSNMKKQLDATA